MTHACLVWFFSKRFSKLVFSLPSDFFLDNCNNFSLVEKVITNRVAQGKWIILVLLENNYWLRISLQSWTDAGAKEEIHKLVVKVMSRGEHHENLCEHWYSSELKVSVCTNFDFPLNFRSVSLQKILPVKNPFCINKYLRPTKIALHETPHWRCLACQSAPSHPLPRASPAALTWL